MRQYETFEIALQGEVLTSEWAQIDLIATFTDCSGETQVKGFYAGDGIYKVRFLPEHTGEVSWKIEGVLKAEGSEMCEPAQEGQHGIVRAKGTALCFSDDTWFHAFGTTIYGLAHQTEELMQETMETLAENPFNKVRMCLFPKHYDYNINDPASFAFMVKDGETYTYDKDASTFPTRVYLKEKAKIWDVRRPDPAFWDHFEAKIRELDALGIQVDLIIFHPYDRWGFSYMSQAENLIYVDYLLRRLAAMPNVWWSMANEYDFCSAKSLEDWAEIEQFIAANDPYHHLLSNHNCGRMYDFDHEEITHCSIQCRTMTLVPELMKKYGKPVLYDECVYEGNLKQTWGCLSGQEMMNRFWKVTTHGGYCTHGEVFLDMDMENIQDAVLWWAKGGKLTGKSPERIAFLRSIMEEIDAPLVPYVFGMAAVIAADGEKADAPIPEEVLDHMPAPFIRFGAYNSMAGEIHNARFRDSETAFAGHAGEDAYLFYYSTDCCARVDIEVPENHTYRIEVIDAWEMTRMVYAEDVSGTYEVKLPGKEYMAVLATRE